MSLLKNLWAIIEKSKEEYKEIVSSLEMEEDNNQEGSNQTYNKVLGRFKTVETYYEPIQNSDENNEANDYMKDNYLAKGDNLSFMKYLLKEKNMKGKIQTIYVDPPFFTKSNYQGSFKITDDMPVVKPEAYEDKWTEGMEEYLEMLCVRLLIMKDLLAEDGLFWIHLDWHVVHYVKIIMDEIFGSDKFINEIIWQYKSGGSSKKHFARKHDTMLLYGKGKKYKINIGKEKSYNRGYKPYRFKGVEEFCDDIGWYTMVNQKDIWQIDMVGRTSKERTGYATQKPVALLKRIIESSTEPGDICADFFCGASGMAIAASDLGRNWICCDMGNLAMGVSQKRFTEEKIGYTYLEETGTDSDNLYEKNKNSDTQEIDFKVTIEKLDGNLTGITLTDYNVNIDKLPISKDEKDKLIVTDNLQLIGYWSIDLNYNGEWHNCQIAFTKDNGRIDNSVVTALPTTGKISVRVVDVFGNSKQKII